MGRNRGIRRASHKWSRTYIKPADRLEYIGTKHGRKAFMLAFGSSVTHTRLSQLKAIRGALLYIFPQRSFTLKVKSVWYNNKGVKSLYSFEEAKSVKDLLLWIAKEVREVKRNHKLYAAKYSGGNNVVSSIEDIK